MSKSESSNSVNLCLNFKAGGDSEVQRLLRDPSQVGDLHPKTLKVTSLLVTSTEPNLEETTNVELSGATVGRMCEIFVSCLHLHCLTKLEVTDTTLDIFLNNNTLTFCHLTNLEELRLVSTQLKSLPYSIGCLKKLQTLDVSKNDLSSLPDTIMHCKQLRSIDISNNRSFERFPGCILDLPHLTSCNTGGTRSNTFTWPGGETNVFLKRSPDSVVQPRVPQLYGGVESGKNPSLQQLAAGAVAQNAVSMEGLYQLPPNLLQQVDNFMLHTKVYICAECKRLLLAGERFSTIYVLAFSFKGLRNISMELKACTGGCDETVDTRLRKWQWETKKELERVYEEMVRKANEEYDMDKYYDERIAELAKLANRRHRCICL